MASWLLNPGDTQPELPKWPLWDMWNCFLFKWLLPFTPLLPGNHPATHTLHHAVLVLCFKYHSSLRIHPQHSVPPPHVSDLLCFGQVPTMKGITGHSGPKVECTKPKAYCSWERIQRILCNQHPQSPKEASSIHQLKSAGYPSAPGGRGTWQVGTFGHW